MRAQQEFGENSNRLPSLRKLDQSRIFAGCDVRVRLAHNECADMEYVGIQPADDLAGVAHLRVEKAFIGKTVHKNPNWPHPSPPRDLVASMSR